MSDCKICGECNSYPCKTLYNRYCIFCEHNLTEYHNPICTVCQEGTIMTKFKRIKKESRGVMDYTKIVAKSTAEFEQIQEICAALFKGEPKCSEPLFIAEIKKERVVEFSADYSRISVCNFTSPKNFIPVSCRVDGIFDEYTIMLRGLTFVDCKWVVVQFNLKISKAAMEKTNLDFQFNLTGEWNIEYKSGYRPDKGVVCSMCDCWSGRKSLYCSNCGAKMNVVKEE